MSNLKKNPETLDEVWKEISSSLLSTLFKISISISFIAGNMFAVGFYIWAYNNCELFYVGWLLSGLGIFVLMGIVHDLFLKRLELLEKEAVVKSNDKNK